MLTFNTVAKDSERLIHYSGSVYQGSQNSMAGYNEYLLVKL